MNIDDNFMETLDSLERLIAENQPNNVLIGADMNVDTERSNAHAGYYMQMLVRCSMLDIWQVFPNRGSY